MTLTLLTTLFITFLCFVQFSNATVRNITDFTAFREKIATIITQQHPYHPITNASTTLDCHFPHASVMFAYTSHYTIDFALIQ